MGAGNAHVIHRTEKEEKFQVYEVYVPTFEEWFRWLAWPREYGKLAGMADAENWFRPKTDQFGNDDADTIATFYDYDNMSTSVERLRLGDFGFSAWMGWCEANLRRGPEPGKKGRGRNAATRLKSWRQWQGRD